MCAMFLREPQLVLRYSLLETFARKNGLSLSATADRFILRVIGNDSQWDECADLDEVAASVERYLMHLNTPGKS
jgi:hypothetical protein